MNKEIYEILDKIESKGYEAYIVGGYVRDFLLGKTSNDIDICTNMPYVELKKQFINACYFDDYGCVKFKIKTNEYSITVYRKEIKYDKNKPIELEYTSELKEDLLRRDFTINSICLNKENEIIDLLGGIDDLTNKKIKLIGTMEIKINEDTTRILRALKYMAILSFKLEDSLNHYIIENKSLLLNIPINKIKEELDIIFKSKNYSIFLNYIKKNQLEEVFGIKVNEIIITDNYLEVWKSLRLTKEFPFTKKEKNYIFNYEN